MEEKKKGSEEEGKVEGEEEMSLRSLVADFKQGDCLFYMMIYPEDVYIQAMQTISQHLAEAHQKNMVIE